MRVAAVLQITDICKGGDLMLQECMEVFRENFKQYSEQWVLDNYVPKDGTYLFINIDDNFSVGNPIEIKPIENRESTGTGNFGISVDFIFRLL